MYIDHNVKYISYSQSRLKKSWKATNQPNRKIDKDQCYQRMSPVSTKQDPSWRVGLQGRSGEPGAHVEWQRGWRKPPNEEIDLYGSLEEWTWKAKLELREDTGGRSGLCKDLPSIRALQQ